MQLVLFKMSTNQGPGDPSQDFWLRSAPVLENINSGRRSTVLLPVVPPVPRTISGPRRGKRADLEISRDAGTVFSSGPVSLHRHGSKAML